MEKINKIKEYIPCLILIFIVFILIISVSYDNLNNTNRKLFIETEKESFKVETEAKVVNNIKYLNIEEYNKILDDNIYLDKISRKVIYTTEKGVKKESIISNENVIYEDSKLWISLKSIEENFTKKTYYIKQINTIFFEDASVVEGKILKNNIEIYYAKQKDTIYNFRINKEDKIYVLNIEENNDNSKFVHVIHIKEDKEYLGYILRENIKYSLDIEKYENDRKETSNTVIGISENNVYSNIDGVNIIAIDSLKLTNPNGNITIQNRSETINKAKNNNQEVYAIIDNDFKASNFDNTITSSMLNSDINRENNINKILKYLKDKDVSGIIVNYKRIKNTDKNIYTQYLRELKSSLNLNGYKLIVKSGLENYIDTDNIINIVDLVIIELYNERTVNSNTSGTHFKYSNLIKKIEEFKEKNVQNKIVIELPMYSILWTERNGIVVQAEIYSSKLEKQYIQKNNAKIIENDILKQRYLEIEKGKITYKMWLEDEYSVKNKVDVIKQNGLKGISLYKFGYETEEIREVISNEF